MYTRITLLDQIITTALSSQVFTVGVLPPTLLGLTLDATFTYGSGGTSVRAYVQTSFDGGTSWMDVAALVFLLVNKRRLVNLRADSAVTTPATPTDGTLTDDTVVNGFLGEHWRVVVTSVGTYAGNTRLRIDGQPKP